MWSFRPLFISIGSAGLLILIWSGDHLFFFVWSICLDRFALWLAPQHARKATLCAASQRLEFYFDINASRQIKAHERIGSGWCWIVDVDKTFVNANFKVLA